MPFKDAWKYRNSRGMASMCPGIAVDNIYAEGDIVINQGFRWISQMILLNNKFVYHLESTRARTYIWNMFIDCSTKWVVNYWRIHMHWFLESSWHIVWNTTHFLVTVCNIIVKLKRFKSCMFVDRFYHPISIAGCLCPGTEWMRQNGCAIISYLMQIISLLLATI